MDDNVSEVDWGETDYDNNSEYNSDYSTEFGNFASAGGENAAASSSAGTNYLVETSGQQEIAAYAASSANKTIHEQSLIPKEYPKYHPSWDRKIAHKDAVDIVYLSTPDPDTTDATHRCPAGQKFLRKARNFADDEADFIEEEDLEMQPIRKKPRLESFDERNDEENKKTDTKERYQSSRDAGGLVEEVFTNFNILNTNDKETRKTEAESAETRFPALSSDLFPRTKVRSTAMLVRKGTSKLSKLAIPPWATRKTLRRKTEKFSAADAFYNSFYFAEETLQQHLKAQENKKILKNISYPKKLNFRGKRRLKKFIKASLDAGKQEIFLHESYFGDVEKNKDKSIIVDSGTTMHIGRDKADFKRISSERVKIRGATGVGDGYKATLKDSELGTEIPAIWFPGLPVRMLLSVKGLDRDGWKTVYGETDPRFPHAYICSRTGKLLEMVDINNLPCLELQFDENQSEISGYKAQIVENPNEWDIECKYCDEPIPKQLEGALVDTKVRGRKKVLKGDKPNSRANISKLLDHQRNCHLFTEATARCRCFDCLEMKGRKASHDKIRDQAKYKIDQPFLLFSTDFFGKIKPKTFRGNNWVMLFCCDSCGYTKAQPIKNKSDAPKTLVDFVREVRSKCGTEPGCKTTRAGQIIFAGIHSDNEPVLRGQEWRAAVHKMGLQELHSVPYNPQMNGTCERMVGTIKSALRTSMHNVDPRVWDYCVEHISKIWNIKNNKKASEKSVNKNQPACPEQIMEQISDNPLF